MIHPENPHCATMRSSQTEGADQACPTDQILSPPRIEALGNRLIYLLNVVRVSDTRLSTRASVDQAKATGGASRPVTELSARTIGLQKEHHYVVWIDACFAKLFDQGGNKAFSLFASVPEDTSPSIINIWSLRGLGSPG